jgi:hypothetical protein
MIRFSRCSSERLDGKPLDGRMISLDLFGLVIELWIMR